MTTLIDRPNTALIVIDVQNGVVADAHQRDAVVANIGTLVDKARAEGVPVVWVQHSDDDLVRGSDEWQYVPELSLLGSEPLIHKTFGDSFEDTDLEDVLAEVGVGRRRARGVPEWCAIGRRPSGHHLRSGPLPALADPGRRALLLAGFPAPTAVVGAALDGREI